MSYSEILSQVDELGKGIRAHAPLSPDLLRKVNYKFRLEWNYTSNSMEGNSLTRSETRSVMIGNITVQGKPLKDVLEMKGHDEVISSILKMGAGELQLSEARMQAIHKGIMHEENPEKTALIGRWKNQDNYLFNYKNERIDFTPHAETPEAMHRLANWLSVEQEKIVRGDAAAMHPALMASRFHLDYVSIHPFYDGNGRTARIFTNLILIAYGYPPVWVKEDERNAYYQYLADVQGYGGSPEVLFEFMSGLLLRSQQLVLDAVEGREIEEPDDWEKQLLLLRAKTEDLTNVKETKNVASLHRLGTQFIIPLISKMMMKYAQMEDLFVGKNVYASTDQGTVDINTGEELAPYFSEAADRPLGKLEFNYQLHGYKCDGANTFQIATGVRWDFEDYRFRMQGNHHSQYGKPEEQQYYLYHQEFTEADINVIVATCGRSLMQQIEAQIKGGKDE